MYPSSSSKSTVPDAGDGGDDGDLNRYVSTAVPTRDFSSLGSQIHHPPLPPSRQQQIPSYFSGESSSKDPGKNLYGFNNEIEQDIIIGASSSSSPALFRHRSSPAGFYDQHLPTDPNEERGFSVGRPKAGYGGGGGGGGGGERGPARLKSELRFSGGNNSSSGQEHNHSLPRISEVEAGVGRGVNGVVSSSMSFGNNNHNNNWDNSSPHISFTIDHPGGKRSKTTDFFTLDTQFNMPQTSLEIARMAENMMNIPDNAVSCRVRAKRGCATHPRSIAERERRTRISGKLKKLQELVPNMDKQTSYADMLDLAVDHIKGLQHQVETLEKGMERCTCGACKKR